MAPWDRISFTMSAPPFSRETVEGVGAVLNDRSRSLAERFRALFTLRGIRTDQAVGEISKCFTDKSALLKHECAYCLGQMQSTSAIPVLRSVLEDVNQEAMVRHEAAEALGAIGDSGVCDVLQKFSSDPSREVAETCQIALARIRWLTDEDSGNFKDNNPYKSIDPAPPVTSGNILKWKEELNDTSLPLFLRYRALFALRNHGGRLAVEALVSGFKDTSALFKHELAYVLGQMQDEAAVNGLREKLSDLGENPMVRHECAEALGSIASDECWHILRDFLSDKERVVRESCVVALDMYEHENSCEFQYADTVGKVCDHS